MSSWISSAFWFCAFSRSGWNSAVERYRSPKEGMTATMRFPAIPGRLPTSSAAVTAAPEEMPHRIPWAPRRRAISIATGPVTFTTSSTMDMSQLPGMNPAPIPWILCGPGLPPDSTADSSGSTAIASSFAFLVLRNLEVPVRVPPVPTPPRNTSILPSVCSQTSGPVVAMCAATLSGLLNCCSIFAFLPSFSTMFSAFLIAPFIPIPAGVRTSLAPRARKSTRRSRDMLSGMQSTSSYPRAAATMASATPVLPEVGSTRVVSPGLISPRFSADSIIASPMRSFTELHGCIDSIFSRISALHSPWISLGRRRSGVRPITSVMSLAILGCSRLYFIATLATRGAAARHAERGSAAARAGINDDGEKAAATPRRDARNTLCVKEVIVQGFV
mmetsp:Transcript_57218/g.136435  ORF Transcript_57218/g.136435 Transcript_57218/m.136435 type:complete len:388 (+) Transcript_57218:348-1511(+)